MPSREEISGWLREAAFAFRAVNCKPLQDQFEKRAAQVENMRCENCEYFDDTPPTGCIGPWVEFDREGAAIDWCGTKFGCFSWKSKEVTDER